MAVPLPAKLAGSARDRFINADPSKGVEQPFRPVALGNTKPAQDLDACHLAHKGQLVEASQSRLAAAVSW